MLSHLSATMSQRRGNGKTSTSGTTNSTNRHDAQFEVTQKVQDTARKFWSSPKANDHKLELAEYGWYITEAERDAGKPELKAENDMASLQGRLLKVQVKTAKAALTVANNPELHINERLQHLKQAKNLINGMAPGVEKTILQDRLFNTQHNIANLLLNAVRISGNSSQVQENFQKAVDIIRDMDGTKPERNKALTAAESQSHATLTQKAAAVAAALGAPPEAALARPQQQQQRPVAALTPPLTLTEDQAPPVAEAQTEELSELEDREDEALENMIANMRAIKATATAAKLQAVADLAAKEHSDAAAAGQPEKELAEAAAEAAAAAKAAAAEAAAQEAAQAAARAAAAGQAAVEEQQPAGQKRTQIVQWEQGV